MFNLVISLSDISAHARVDHKSNGANDAVANADGPRDPGEARAFMIRTGKRRENGGRPGKFIKSYWFSPPVYGDDYARRRRGQRLVVPLRDCNSIQFTTSDKSLGYIAVQTNELAS